MSGKLSACPGCGEIHGSSGQEQCVISELARLRARVADLLHRTKGATNGPQNTTWALTIKALLRFTDHVGAPVLRLGATFDEGKTRCPKGQDWRGECDCGFIEAREAALKLIDV